MRFVYTVDRVTMMIRTYSELSKFFGEVSVINDTSILVWAESSGQTRLGLTDI